MSNKTTVAAIYLIGYCTGNMTVPQAFRLYDGPQSLPDETTISLCTSACHFIVECILRRYRSENKRKAKIRATLDDVRLENQEWLDLTDRENHDFVYSL